LRGYDLAVEKSGIGQSDPFLSEFRDWIHQRYQTTARSWEDVILDRSTDEVTAVEQFWQLFDEFLNWTKVAANGPADSKKAACNIEGLIPYAAGNTSSDVHNEGPRDH
jgi:hypothetical protein